MMNRDARVAKANETLDILHNGRYSISECEVNIEKALERSVAGAMLYRSDEFEQVMASAAERIAGLKQATKITVENATVLKAAARLCSKEGAVGCLNFASAKNPGGGFLNGALAQEESLALSSTLYATQMRHFELYDYNRGRRTFLYSDHMIYSPDVVVFRDDEGELLDSPYCMSLITSPAVNLGAMQGMMQEELAQVEAVMLRRMDKVLALFVHHGVTRLLLGAWGCGVFKNHPAQIATWFAHYLTRQGKYARCFDEVFFAVYDTSKRQENIQAFQRKFL